MARTEVGLTLPVAKVAYSWHPEVLAGVTVWVETATFSLTGWCSFDPTELHAHSRDTPRQCALLRGIFLCYVYNASLELHLETPPLNTTWEMLLTDR